MPCAGGVCKPSCATVSDAAALPALTDDELTACECARLARRRPPRTSSAAGDLLLSRADLHAPASLAADGSSFASNSASGDHASPTRAPSRATLPRLGGSKHPIR